MHTVIPKQLLLGLSFTCLILVQPENSLSAENSCNASGQTPATYKSSSGALLKVCFSRAPSKVNLLLPQGASMTLPVAVSGSGARYSDGKHTFWEHRGVARYFIDEQLLFEGPLLQSDGPTSSSPAEKELKGITPHAE